MKGLVAATITLALFFLAAADVRAETVSLTAGEIVDTFRANPLAAKKRFAGKTIRLTGKVSAIKEGTGGAAFVQMGNGWWEGYIVELRTTEADAIELVADQQATFSCTSVRNGERFDRDVHLSGCRKL